MAILRTETCDICGETKTEARGGSDYSRTCYDCAKMLASQKRRMHLEGLKALTVDERLAKIEAWIYDYKPSIDSMRVLY